MVRWSPNHVRCVIDAAAIAALAVPLLSLQSLPAPRLHAKPVGAGAELRQPRAVGPGSDGLQVDSRLVVTKVQVHSAGPADAALRAARPDRWPPPI